MGFSRTPNPMMASDDKWDIRQVVLCEGQLLKLSIFYVLHCSYSYIMLSIPEGPLGYYALHMNHFISNATYTDH